MINGGDTNLKQRIHRNEIISVAFGSPSMALEEVRAHAAAGHDMIFIDGQHQPIDEQELTVCCRTASDHGVPVALRIKHPGEAYLAGRYLDFGPIAIIVPMVEREETVLAAIESCYYPPVGRRSWGPNNAYGWRDREAQGDYAQWWNCHGILILQFESVTAVLAAEHLVKPGVDMVVFGEQDMLLDIAARPDARFRSFAACREHVIKTTVGMDVKIAASNSPVGAL